MPITKFFEDRITFNVDRNTINMNDEPDGVFKLTLVVRGSINGGGSYRFKIFEKDLFFDDDLYIATGNGVSGTGNFGQTHEIDLFCKDNGDIAGEDGSTGESSTEVFALIEDEDGNTTCHETDPIRLSCVSDDDDEEIVGVHGGDFRTRRKLNVHFPEGALAKAAAVPISETQQMPLRAFFRGCIGDEISTVRVGADDQTFQKNVLVRWMLTDGELARLSQLEGLPVAFDPASEEWKPIDGASLKGRELTFETMRGGLFGVTTSTRFENVRADRVSTF